MARKFEDGLLRTDACFERHVAPRKFQYDERVSETFSGGDRALAREEEFLASAHTGKSRGEYIPRYNSFYTRRQAVYARVCSADDESLFSTEERVSSQERGR